MGGLTLFEVLDRYSDKDATDIAYFVIKMITKADNETAIQDVPHDLSDELLKVAENILESIVKRLPNEGDAEWDARTEESIGQLYQYIEDRTVSDEPEDVERGKRLLEKLKESEG